MGAVTVLSRIRLVLSRPSHPGNIGAAARAMKTMGFDDLALVAPRHFPDPDASAMAAGAADVLAGARVFATLEGALADCALAVGFSARERELSHAPSTLRDAAPSLIEAAALGSIALVFGNETSGLSNEELARCQCFVMIPSNPAYGSLNLAAAVQLACYELSVAARAFAPPATRERGGASLGDVEGLFAHLESVAVSSGFLDPAKPGRFMERRRRPLPRVRVRR